jgi:ribonuclease HII
MAFIVGIDEAGRGPLAGPVAVGAVSVAQSEGGRRFAKKFFKGIKDSKKLSLVERELWLSLAFEAKRRGELDFHVALVSEKVIDKKGIAYAIKLGIKRCLKSLKVSSDAQIFLDGSLKAPEEFRHQKTIIKGDELVPIISLASIAAKVTRDRRMVWLAKIFPEFGFDIHKGYGTRGHYEAIEKYGLTASHRRSFLKGFDTR